KPGPGDYYQLPKRSGRETLIEPYQYTVAGKDMLLTTTSVPIVVDGRFVGVAGIDVSLSSLQEKVQAIRVYDTGYASLLSAGGLYVGDRDPANVGKAMTAAQEREPLEAALREGRPVQARYVDERLDTEVARIYVPLRVGKDQALWAFAATVPQERILAEVNALRVTAWALGAVSVALVSLGLL